MTKHHLYTYLCPLCSGLAMAASFCLPGCFWLSWLALMPLFYALCQDSATSRRRPIGMVALYALAFYLPLLSFFFALHPLDYLGFGNAASLTLISLAWLLMTAGEVAGFSLLGLALVKLRPATAASRLLLLCALWLLLEWVQGLTAVGFTWGRLGVAQASQPLLIQGAALGGTLLLSALILAVNALLTLAWLNKDKRFLLLAVAVFALNLGGGALRLAVAPAENPQTLPVGIVQGSIPSQLKWQPDTVTRNRAQYYEQSLAAAQAGAKLIIWPETSLAELIREDHIPAGNLYQQVAWDSQTPLLAGVQWEQEDGKTYNALIYAQQEGLQFVYGKRFLVPFGEYMPFSEVLAPLLPGLADFLTDDMHTYQNNGMIKTAEAPLGGLICIESIFPPLARTSVAAGAEALAVATNDSWFWGTAAMRQHYWQAQLRAVEQNRYVLRAANAGYSGVIDNFGRSLAEIAPENSGFLLADTPLLQEHTPYYFLREWVLGISFIIIARYLWPRIKRPR